MATVLRLDQRGGSKDRAVREQLGGYCNKPEEK